MNWQGKWIFAEGETSPRNYYWLARRGFELPANFSEVSIHVTADSRYSLYVNGRYVGFGPVRAFTHRWRYDSYDITPYVKPGANAVGVLVQSFGHSTFQYLNARGGLLAQVECDGGVVAATGDTWRGAEHPSYSRQTPRVSCQQGWAEDFDARVDPLGWAEPGFDDSTWEPAQVIGEPGCEPWTELAPRDVPFLTNEPVYPARVMGARLVRAPRHVWTVDLKPYFVPGDLTANPKPMNGLLATVLSCSESVSLSISSGHILTSVCGLRIDGAGVTDGRVELEAGEHLLMAKADAGWYHEWSANFVVDYDSGSLTAHSPLGEDQPCPFVVLGPFDSADDPAKLAAWDAKSLAEIVDQARAVEVEHFVGNRVSGVTSSAVPLAGAPEVDEPGAMLAESEDCTILHPPTGGDCEIMLDFGKELVGFLEIDLRAPEGAVIEFNGFENIQDGRVQWTHGLENTFRYTTRGGWQSWRSIVRRGFRYATLTVRFPEGCAEPIRLKSLRCVLNTYPYADKGRFECGDYLINAAWEISRHTTRLCSEDTFVDCPAYEQTFWVGDSRNESLFAYMAFGDYALARRCLLLAGESLWRSPIVESQVPSGWENLLPAWSLLWAIACEEHYRFSGDRAFLEEVYPAMRGQNLSIRERFINADGLFEIEGWNMLDWAPMDTPASGIVTHQNMWLVAAYRATADAARVLGKADDAKLFEDWADELKAAINRRLFSEEKQAYLDSIHSDGEPSAVFSQQTQTVAYLCDIVPPNKRELFEGYLTQVPEGWVVIGSPFMMAFTIEALDKAGDHQAVLDLIRKWWGLQLDNDATTCWETFPAALGADWHTRSYCHAWSAAPAFALPSYVLGVRPLEPGFARFEVRPDLCDLGWARGAVPTPFGEIAVDLTRAEGKLCLDLTVPAGTVAVVNGKDYPPAGTQ